MYYSGEQMSAPTSINMPLNVFPGATVDVTVNMIAPNTAGQYRGFWIFANANGTMFGIGLNASDPFWVEIKVAGDTFNEFGYDFWTNACAAQWKSGAGSLPCPGTAGDSNGFIIPDSHTELEDGTKGPAPSLLMSPQNKYNGYIQGTYPAFTVQPGDVFHATVGCENGYSCYVTFHLDYMNPNGYIGNFWTWREQSDKMNFTADVDLTPLAGKSVKFILMVLATGSPNGDRVRWVASSIRRQGTSLPPTITPIPPTITITPPTTDWQTYTNSTYGFQFKYPPQSEVFNQFPKSLLMNLPIIPGTNLGEKYLEMSVTQNAGTCQSPIDTIHGTSETVTINGISFLKQTGGDANVGNLHEVVAYSTARDNTCVSMGFVLHSLAAGNYDPPQLEFDRAAESAVFLQMMSTFTWITSNPSPTSIPPTITPHPPSPTITPIANPGTLVTNPQISKLHMLNSSNGWAVGNGYLLRTTDGGATWYNMLPVNPTGAYFPTSTKGWVIGDYSETNVGSLYRTTSGGQNWTRYDVPFNNGYIQFLDDNTGYVLEITGAAMNKQSVILFKTTDGGATWVQNYNNDPNAPGAGNSLPHWVDIRMA